MYLDNEVEQKRVYLKIYHFIFNKFYKFKVVEFFSTLRELGLSMRLPVRYA
jgi:hypothetical protein